MVEEIVEELYARKYVNWIVNRAKDELRIAFLGGSLSKGEMVKKELCFVSLFEKQIADVLGGDKEVSILRYGESGTLSANGLFKVGKLIEDKPDLVFVDYAMNDPGDRYLWETTEGILYQLCQAGCGVVVLLFCNDRGQCTRGAMERAANHYHLPVYDIGKMIYSRIGNGGLTWQKYAQDYVHPTEYGHELIAGYLLALFEPVKDMGDGGPEENVLPKEPAFEGAFRKMRLLDLTGQMQSAKKGEIVFSGEIEATMILMEFWQCNEPNEAGAVIYLDDRKAATADAYASMAWGNPVSRYIGGDGSRRKHQLTISLLQGTPPAGWDYSRLRLRFLLGQ